MSLEAIGAVLAVMVIIFIIGRIWFHLVERILGGLKRLFCRRQPAAWHPLPPEQDKEDGMHV